MGTMCGWDSRGRGFGLARETSPDFLLEGQLGRENLDGDAAFQPFVTRAIDDAHAAAPDFALDRVGIAQRFGQAWSERRGRICH